MLPEVARAVRALAGGSWVDSRTQGGLRESGLHTGGRGRRSRSRRAWVEPGARSCAGRRRRPPPRSSSGTRPRTRSSSTPGIGEPGRDGDQLPAELVEREHRCPVASGIAGDLLEHRVWPLRSAASDPRHRGVDDSSASSRRQVRERRKALVAARCSSLRVLALCLPNEVAVDDCAIEVKHRLIEPRDPRAIVEVPLVERLEERRRQPGAQRFIWAPGL
jgi:hypothetical protein